ncbi:MAG: toprim domain-containing protein [Pyrinomonadaceae bacterium]
MDQQSNAQRQLSLRLLCEEIKGRLDHHSFFLRYCPDAQITGSRLKSRCPIPAHGHTGLGQESFSVDLRRGLYHCFSRGDGGGDAIRFYEQMHGVSFARAVSQMAAELGLRRSRMSRLSERASPDADLFAAPETVNSVRAENLSAVCEKFLEVCRAEDQTEGVDYLVQRRISLKVIKALGVTYFPRGCYRRVMKKMLDSFKLAELQESGLFNAEQHLTFYRHRLLFPFYLEKRPVYLQARTTTAGVKPRWHNLRGTVPTLYNADCLADLKSGEIVYLVEGFTDTLTLLTHNFAAVGLVGAGGLKSEWVPQLARFKVIVALDGDHAGTNAAVRYAEIFQARQLHAARVTLPTDVNDFFQHNSSAALEMTLMAESALERSFNCRGG